MYKLCFYVPEEALETVKNAVFEAGAGRIGNYDCCAWQTSGSGQFQPLTGSHPHIGKQGEIETVAEYKVEMVCEDDCIHGVIASLKASHPYEEPAYDVWRLDSI